MSFGNLDGIVSSLLKSCSNHHASEESKSRKKSNKRNKSHHTYAKLSLQVKSTENNEAVSIFDIYYSMKGIFESCRPVITEVEINKVWKINLNHIREENVKKVTKLIHAYKHDKITITLADD